LFVTALIGPEKAIKVAHKRVTERRNGNFDTVVLERKKIFRECYSCLSARKE